MAGVLAADSLALIVLLGDRGDISLNNPFCLHGEFRRASCPHPPAPLRSRPGTAMRERGRIGRIVYPAAATIRRLLSLDLHWPT